ncbi:MAG: hypothetical protein J0L88_10210 [Xanthomonadales bacterium]|nr:hypothetical protein [Xanthomonadales bacterium]
MSRTRSLLPIHVLSAVLLIAPVLSSAFVGDAWRTVRGDRSAGAAWNALTETASGRLVGVGAQGWMTVSDDGGLSWTDRRLMVDGEAQRVELTDIIEFGVGGSPMQRRLAAIGAWLEVQDPPLTPFVARTYVFLSDDGGVNWSRHPFPFDVVSGTPFGEFEGINLSRLFVSSSGELLAYGTTTVSYGLPLVWNIGGLVYRSGNGLDWQRATFELGPLYQMAGVSSGARLVAAGSSTVTDSADGAGWNGYLMRNASITLGAQSMDATTRTRLRIEDIVWHGGTYIAEAATYVPYDESGSIDSGSTDRLFTLTSTAPFAGSRAWTATEQPRRYGKLLSAGGNLVRVGLGGVYQRSGSSWSWVSWNPVAAGNAVTKTAAGSYVGLGANESDTRAVAAWKSGDGVAWTKTWDTGGEPDLRLVGRSNDTLFACEPANFQGSAVLDASIDNGETWVARATLPACGNRMIQRGGRLLLLAPGGVLVSDDNGSTWQARNFVPNPSSFPASALALANGGRIVVGARGNQAARGGDFFVSDDGGETWSARTTVTQFGDQVADIVLAPNGRLIATVQYNPPFYPRLMLSDDNGQTWRIDTQLQSLPGLIPISGGVHQGIAMRRFARSGNRLLLQGDEAIISSDDSGATWTTRIATFYTNNVRGGPWWGSLYGLERFGHRWIAPMVYVNGSFGNNANAVLASDDGGNTWFRIVVPTRYALFNGLLAGFDGRAVISGSRGAILLADGMAEAVQPPQRLTVRASDALVVPVPRPPLTGAVRIRYSAVADRDAPTGTSAIASTDYMPTVGVLEWSAGDIGDRAITLQTLDSGASGAAKLLKLQLVTEGDLGGSAQIPVTITNARSNSNYELVIGNIDDLMIRAGGAPVRFRIALTRQPSADVTVNLANGAPAVAAVTPASLTFTPTDWIASKEVTITPTATAGYATGGSTRTIAITTSSSDTRYNAIGPYATVYWIDNNLLYSHGFD